MSKICQDNAPYLSDDHEANTISDNEDNHFSIMPDLVLAYEICDDVAYVKRRVSDMICTEICSRFALDVSTYPSE
jgi:hypothetical protein